MANAPVDEVVSKRDICKAQGVTPGFLIKIMQPLIAKGLVKSYRGMSGGFALGRPAGQISLWDIIEAVEGPILLNKCLIHPGYCERDENCPVHRIWITARDALRDILGGTTLAELAQRAQ